MGIPYFILIIIKNASSEQETYCNKRAETIDSARFAEFTTSDIFGCFSDWTCVNGFFLLSLQAFFMYNAMAGLA